MARRAFLARFSAAAAALALAPSATGVRAAGRDAVYERIWDVDQAANGIPAIAADQAGDPTRGFVKVDARPGRAPEHRLFAEVHIPAHKRRSYDLCKALFDNYRLDQTKPENNRPEEAREILALLDALTDGPPMLAAREHLEAQSGARFSRDAWQELIFDIWFRQFDEGRNLDLSAFEHVAVGEQKDGKVNGHHFWYKYYLDDWAAFSGHDDIDYDGSRYDGPHRREGKLTPIGRQVPEVVTHRVQLGRLRRRDWGAARAVQADRRLLGRVQHRGAAGARAPCVSSSAAGSRPRSTARATRSSCTAARTAAACAPSSRVSWASRERHRFQAVSKRSQPYKITGDLRGPAVSAELTIAIAQTNPTVGDIPGNLARIRAARARCRGGRAPTSWSTPSWWWSAIRRKTWC